MNSLKDYQKLEEEITYLEFNLERTELELKRWISGDLAKYKLTADSDGAKVEEHIERIKRELAFKQEQMKKLTDLIEKFKGLDNNILKMKYIDGMTLEQIAYELNYSTRYICNKHAEIMKIIKFVEKTGLGG